MVLTSLTEDEFTALVEKATEKALDRINSQGRKDLPRKDSEYFPDWMTVKQCAKFRGTTSTVVYKDVYANRIPYYKKRGRIFFNKQEIIEWLNIQMKSKRILTEIEMKDQANELSSK